MKGIVRHTMVALLLLSAAFATAQKKSAFEKINEYMIGEWRAKNKGFEKGNGQPEYYGYNFKWSLDKQVMLGEIFGITEGGTRQTYWHSTAIWDYSEKKVRLGQFGRSGMYAGGLETMLNDSMRVVNLDFTSWDGTVSAYTDTSWIKGPDEFHTVSYFKVSEDSIRYSSFEWKRHKEVFPNFVTPEETAQLDFLVGEWHVDLKRIDKEGNIAQKLVSTALFKKDFDKKLITSDMRNPEGLTMQRTWYFYHTLNKQFYDVNFDMAGNFEIKVGEFQEDGSLTMAYREPVDYGDGTPRTYRKTIKKISPDHFKFYWHSTADGGKTWVLHWDNDFRRI